ncbi:putative bifunctional diguanylate cyclase/phosphodiesterase [Pelosinus sp. sgz500959]|uniref:putative bifunctional diguanylate cyclase/phosphodiesterase n=1 Tax=Pelosinus sp. sgz500959 TaxID=3242472 RepID=UPI00366F2E0A
MNSNQGNKDQLRRSELIIDLSTTSQDSIKNNSKISQTNQAILESIATGISSLVYIIDTDTYELIYRSKAIDELWGERAVSQKCYELFGKFAPCPNCPSREVSLENECLTWERYDKVHDRYYFAEAKVISWPDGRKINVAFVTDISRVKKAENLCDQNLVETVNELQKLSTSLQDEIIERQISQQELIEKSLDIQRIAYFDSLTGLPNRAYINERMRTEIEKARINNLSGAVLFIDLDDLKMVNDSFGHSKGDAVIILAGAYILSEVGENACVARIGGDEFIVILYDEGNRKRLATIADQLIKVLYKESETLGVRFQLSASIGVAVYPDDGNTAEDIFKNADMAMYAAKKAGKNCWRFYEAAMHKDTYESMMLTNSLRHAIERKELLLNYQPQVNTSDLSIVGFEALLRWNSLEHGSISPGKFIPLAEKSRLILTIGKWVLEGACRFARRLVDSGWGNLYVAVNVSPHQLRDRQFVQFVREALKNANIEPSQLELEITENALIDSMEETIDILNELKTIGVRLSLDDFGTGYSSLTYLQRLPVNILKIDKSFIDMLRSDKEPKAIIRTIVDMAHVMNMTVVAEGVETQEQIDYLVQCNCERIQGYIVSRPVPEEDIIKFLYDDRVALRLLTSTRKN